MKLNHTPAPWFVLDGNYPLGTISVNKDLSTRICTIRTGFESNVAKEVEANARLIAAAPEMFEVIEELYKWAIDNKTFGPVFPKLEAAYLKASGEKENAL